MKAKGGSLLVTEAYDHSNDPTYRSFEKFFNEVLIMEIFQNCHDIGQSGKVKHLCAKAPSGSQRPSKWSTHKKVYEKLLGIGTFDMIFVKGYVFICCCSCCLFARKKKMKRSGSEEEKNERY
jgi:hypothetical protein